MVLVGMAVWLCHRKLPQEERSVTILVFASHTYHSAINVYLHDNL